VRPPPSHPGAPHRLPLVIDLIRRLWAASRDSDERGSRRFTGDGGEDKRRGARGGNSSLASDTNRAFSLRLSP